MSCEWLMLKNPYDAFEKLIHSFEMRLGYGMVRLVNNAILTYMTKKAPAATVQQQRTVNHRHFLPTQRL